MPPEPLIAMPRFAVVVVCLFGLSFMGSPAPPAPASASASKPMPVTPSDAFRVLSWNVSQENFFKLADRYRSVLRLANPDLLLLDEIQGGRTPSEVAAVLTGIRGTNDARWNIIIGSAGGYQRAAVVSRYPLEPVPELDGLRYPEPEVARLRSLVPEAAWNARVQRSLDLGIPSAGAVVRIGDRGVLAVAIDLQCCNGTNDWPEVRRQVEMRIIRDAIQRALERRRVDALLVAGDWNLVGGSVPLDILTQSHLPPHGPLVPAPAAQLDGVETWTWDGRGSAFPSGRLDYSLYSPGSLAVSRAIVLSTEDVSPDLLSGHGLHPGTSRELSDHLPVIVDYHWRSPTSPRR